MGLELLFETTLRRCRLALLLLLHEHTQLRLRSSEAVGGVSASLIGGQPVGLGIGGQIGGLALLALQRPLLLIERLQQRLEVIGGGCAGIHRDAGEVIAL